MINLKEELITQLKKNNFSKSKEIIVKLLNSGENYQNTFFISKSIKKYFNLSNLKKVRFAILSSFAINEINQYLDTFSFLNGYYLELYTSPYGQYNNDIIDSDSNFYRFQPDMVLIFLRISDMLHIDTYDLMFGNQIPEFKMCEIVDNMTSTINYTMKKRSQIYVCNMDYPGVSVRESSSNLHLDNFEKIRQINNDLEKNIKKYNNVKLLNWTHFIYLYGYRNIFNHIKESISQNPINSNFYYYFVNELFKFINNDFNHQYKCIAVDADNTLWGGVIGEDGLFGIKIDDSYPGIIFNRIQKLLLKFHSMGILLVLISKNNYEDIENVLINHPNMVLKKEHFTVILANWEEKYKNLLDCAKKLNLGLDSFIFIDDNPLERDKMRKALPEVSTIELPVHIDQYLDVITDFPILEKDNITQEDRERNKMYQSEFKRIDFKNMFNNINEYYENLDISIEINFLKSYLIDRTVNMINKTNQFNLTTKRYTKNELEIIKSNKNFKIFTLSAKDKFGSYGMVGLSIVKEDTVNLTWTIDTFLISCRILGRKIEEVFLYQILDFAKNDGISKVIGKYKPSNKNGQVKDFYEKFHFQQNNIEDDFTENWELELKNLDKQQHNWIKIINFLNSNKHAKRI